MKPAKKPLRNRDGRVVSYLCYDLTFTRGCTEAEEVLHGGKVGCLDVFGENPLTLQQLGRGREVLSGEHSFLSLGSTS